MPDDKRPRPTIDMTAERISQAALLRGRRFLAERPPERASQKRGGGFAGYLLAGAIGGMIAAGGGYFAAQARHRRIFADRSSMHGKRLLGWKSGRLRLKPRFARSRGRLRRAAISLAQGAGERERASFQARRTLSRRRAAWTRRCKPCRRRCRLWSGIPARRRKQRNRARRNCRADRGPSAAAGFRGART